MPSNQPDLTGSKVRQAGHVLVCDRCGRIVACELDDLLRYTKVGWPKCCHEVMALFEKVSKPAPADTPLDTPQLPSDDERKPQSGGSA